MQVESGILSNLVNPVKRTFRPLIPSDPSWMVTNGTQSIA